MRDKREQRDKIELKNMSFYGYHGVLAAEKKLGQRFEVTVKIFCDLRPAAESDQLEKSLDYARIYREIKEIVEGRPFNLLEALAEAIAARLQEMGAPAVQVQVKKMHPPLPGQLDYAAVEIARSRGRGRLWGRPYLRPRLRPGERCRRHREQAAAVPRRQQRRDPAGAAKQNRGGREKLGSRGNQGGQNEQEKDPVTAPKWRRKQPVLAYLGLGGNIGPSRTYLLRAIGLLANHPSIAVERISPFLETKPVGYLEQPNFLNGVVQIATSLTPQELLAATQAIENKLGRKRTIRWGPRTIDIDILLYGDLMLESPTLTIPHPRMLERAFVLKPLAMLAPGLRIPGCDAPVSGLAQKLRHKSRH